MSKTHEEAAAERSPEQQKADYEVSHAAKQRILANPDTVAMLRGKLAQLRQRTGR